MNRIYALLLSTGPLLSATAQAPQSTSGNYVSTNPLVLTPSGVKSINLLSFDADSLKGFDEKAVHQSMLAKGLPAREAFKHIDFLKREFIRQKYNLPVAALLPSGKFSGGTSVINSTPCVNEGFESTSPGAYSTANAVSGWTVSSHNYTGCISPGTSWSGGSNQFAILATPVFSVPVIGTLPHSPLGGAVVALLNNYTPDYKCTRLAQNFPVTTANSLFRYAFAGVWDDGGSGHSCCEQPGFSVVVKDCSGNITACFTHSNTPASTTCSTGISNYSITSGMFWSSWQMKAIDLSPFIGSCVTIEVIAFDCAFGGHKGFTFFDAVCGSAYQLPCNCPTLQQPGPVSFCPGGPAVIQGPAGYATYSWTSPTGTLSPSTATLPSLSIANPVVNSVYTLNVTTPANCLFTATFALVHTQVSIGALGATGSCSLGASGSATVVGNGSGSGYAYMWTNSSNSVVSSSSVAANLAPGIYSIYITASNNGFCGSATSTVSISNNVVNVSHLTKPYCGSWAYLNTPGGTNFQWYSNNSAISGTTGTAPTMTVYFPTPGAIFKVRYTTPQGCKDSIIYTLQSAPPPTVGVTYNQLTCQGSNNGVAVIALTPAIAQAWSANSYSVFSTGLTPSYSSTSAVTTSNTFTASGLAGAGTYSVLVFDGSCYASTSFSVNTYFTANLYSLSTIGSTALCQGGTMPVGVVFTNTNNTFAQFTYTWQPNSFLVGNNPHLPNTLITPTVAAGTGATLVYTVLISPTVAVCAISKTVAIQVSNPGSPAVTGPGTLCNNTAPFQLAATPPGGTFINGGQSNAISSSGILSPALANLGPNSFSYAVSVNNCTAQTSSGYTVINAPVLTVTGNNTICAGSTTTLSASGALMFFWPGLGTSADVVVSPSTTVSYVVVGSSGNGCTDSKMVTVHVTPVPALHVSGNLAVCPGDTAILTATGAQTYTWSTGGNNATEFIQPKVTGTYSILGVNNPGNCSGSLVFTVTVSPVPTIAVTGPSSVCAGEPVVLNASGASSYLWNNVPGPATYSTLIHSTAFITVTGINQFGCRHTQLRIVSADACTGLPEGDLAGGLKVYPNPVRTSLQIDVPVPGRLTIYEAGGKLIYSAGFARGLHAVDVSAFSSGLYLLHFSTPNQSQVLRLIKEH